MSVDAPAFQHSCEAVVEAVLAAHSEADIREYVLGATDPAAEIEDIAYLAGMHVDQIDAPEALAYLTEWMGDQAR